MISSSIDGPDSYGFSEMNYFDFSKAKWDMIKKDDKGEDTPRYKAYVIEKKFREEKMHSENLVESARLKSLEDPFQGVKETVHIGKSLIFGFEPGEDMMGYGSMTRTALGAGLAITATVIVVKKFLRGKGKK